MTMRSGSTSAGAYSERRSPARRRLAGRRPPTRPRRTPRGRRPSGRRSRCSEPPVTCAAGARPPRCRRRTAAVRPERQPPRPGRRRRPRRGARRRRPLVVADGVPLLGCPADHHHVFERGSPRRPFSHRITQLRARSVTTVGDDPASPARTSAASWTATGGGRQRRGQPRTAGHTEGEENIARLVRVAVRRNIGWLTVFGFSTENWVRPRDRGAPHPRPAQEAVRPRRRAQRAQRAGAVDRPAVRLARARAPRS